MSQPGARAQAVVDERVTTSVASALAVMQALNHLLYLENFQRMAPLIRQELERNGVVFPAQAIRQEGV